MTALADLATAVDGMTALADLATADLEKLEARIQADFQRATGNRIQLDLTRGKPAADQLDLSRPMDDILAGSYSSENGIDSRNYGGLRGLPEACALGAEILGVSAERVICWGNASLTLMHLTADTALRTGLWGDERR